MWWEKIRFLYGKLTPKTAGYWREIITDIHNRVNKQMKKGKPDSIYLTEKQKDMIDGALEKHSIKLS